MKELFANIRKISILSLIFFFLQGIKIPAQKLIVGYYPQYGSSVVAPQNIQFDNLTHIIHCFAWPNSDGTVSMYDGMQNSILIAEAHKAGVKVLLALGGAGYTPTTGFEIIAADSIKRAVFVNDIMNLVVSKGYDGIDLDWEFPDNADEKPGYTVIVKDFREAINNIDPSLTLSIAASSNNFYGQWFEYEKMAANIDWFNLLAYEYNGSWSSLTGHNSPLYQWKNNHDGSADESVKYMNVTRKIPRDKIVLGIPFYGKMYASSDLNQPWDSLTTENPVLGLTYRDLINSINETYTYNFDEEAQAPYYVSTSENRFISFDDTISVREKAKYVIDKELKGVMIWEITQDKLSDNSQPLLEQIGRTIKTYIPTTAAIINALPDEYKLFSNYPNPFNPTTKIKFSIPAVGTQHAVYLRVFNVLGKEVATLVNGNVTPGTHEVEFNAKNLSSGVYFYSLIAGDRILTNKMILLK